jgi:hypothetical protein
MPYRSVPRLSSAYFSRPVVWKTKAREGEVRDFDLYLTRLLIFDNQHIGRLDVGDGRFASSW